MNGSSRFLVVLAFAATGLLGCSDQVDEQDALAKKKLSGTWYTTSMDTEFESTRHSLVRVRDEGRFESRSLVIFKDGRRRDETTSGEWFVTTGLFKRLHKTRGDKQLSATRYLYETCRIATLIETHLDCVYDVAKEHNNYERVDDSFQFPVN